MFERFKRRKSKMEKNQNTQPEPEVQATAADNPEIVAPSVNQVDLAVAKKLGTLEEGKAPLPYSTDKALVNDMVAYARENKVKLPLFTSDPEKIANAIAKEGN